MVGVIASNRIGDELNNNVKMNFYGHSLIINETGEVVKEMDSDKEGYASYAFDLESLQNKDQNGDYLEIDEKIYILQ